METRALRDGDVRARFLPVDRIHRDLPTARSVPRVHHLPARHDHGVRARDPSTTKVRAWNGRG